jgi:hypothetical protein
MRARGETDPAIHAKRNHYTLEKATEVKHLGARLGRDAEVT